MAVNDFLNRVLLRRAVPAVAGFNHALDWVSWAPLPIAGFCPWSVSVPGEDDELDILKLRSLRKESSSTGEIAEALGVYDVLRQAGRPDLEEALRGLPEVETRGRDAGASLTEAEVRSRLAGALRQMRRSYTRVSWRQLARRSGIPESTLRG